MKIVLATAPDEDSSWNVGSFPPLGLLYVAASVRHLAGVQVKIIDTYAEGLDIDQAVARILSHEPDMLGVTVTSKNFREAGRLTAGVKRARPQCLTIFGGIHPTLFDGLLLEEIPELDFVFRGEAEEGFPELCKRLLKGKAIAGVPGLSFRSDDGVVRGEPQRIQDLDAIPFPDRNLLDSRNYGAQWYGFKLPRTKLLTTMSSSRGCPYHCTFCSCVRMFGDRWRPRSAENVFQELQQVAKEGYQGVIFFDDNFTGGVERLNHLCRLILQHNLKMSLACAGTLHNIPDDTLKLMHQAGFDFFFLGVESGSDAQLRRYRKPTSSARLAYDMLRLKKAHIVIIASFITGSAGESSEDHEASKELVRKTRPQIAEINPLMVYPGSPLWEKLNGPQAPESLEKSGGRMISRFAGQMPKETIRARERDFRQTFQKTWGRGRRFLEFMDLLYHNKSVRLVLKYILKDPKVVLQLVRGWASRV